MPTLVDAQSKTFKAYGNPGLPSVVLISPAGTILRYHEGVFPEGFYSTTNLDTEVRLGGKWVRVEWPEIDADARDIAQAHGGSLTLCNLPGGGLEAVLLLPRRR